MDKRTIWILIIIAALAIVVWLAIPSNADPVLKGKEVVVYKSMSCGCCGTYSEYAESRGMNVQVITADDNTQIKDQYKIPFDLRSCHTMVIDGYFVEGHVPTEAITKLLQERPDIAGIAIQGMPMGSPGMPGSKEGPFIVYAVNKDGTYKEYVRI